ncbi:MAG: hypothetical protein EOO39_17645, partial [Cytophagaceae bacterium]
VLRPADRSTVYSYDATGQVTQIRYSDGTQEIYGYDEAGALIKAQNQTNTVRLDRDAVGRVIRESQDANWVDYVYDALGQRTQLTSSLGAAIGFDRDQMGNLTRLSSQSWQAQFGYDQRGLEVQRQLSGGVQMTWQRDTAGRPTQQRITAGGDAPRQRTYAWTMGDVLRQIDDSQWGVSQYEHDIFGALTKATYADGTQELRLPDAVGNLFERADKTDRQYGPGGQLLRSQHATYAYDAEGNLTHKTTAKGKVWHYEWAGNGMLSQVVRPDGQTVSFTYDALGRRVSKSYKSKTTRWVWEGNKPLHEWSELSLDGDNTEDVITWLFEEDSFAPVGKLQGTSRHSILTDHLGTPLELVDQSGLTQWSAQTTSYGRVRLEKGTRAECPFRFQGQYEDVETGLYYNRFRYYAPQEGMYVSQDPIGLRGGRVLYRYAKAPLTRIDAFGLESIDLFRGMTDINGIPKVGGSARELGARPGVDIPIDANGNVHPNTGGISVSPSPNDLPSHRKPPGFGGTGKDPVWKINTNDLGGDLKHIPDKPGHGTIQPSRTMSFDDYQKALADTQKKWKKVCP